MFGGSITWSSKYRLRHLNSGRYLHAATVDGGAVGDEIGVETGTSPYNGARIAEETRGISEDAKAL